MGVCVCVCVCVCGYLFAWVFVVCVEMCMVCCVSVFVCMVVGWCVCGGACFGSVNGVFICIAQTSKRCIELVRNFVQYCRNSCLRQISNLNTNPTLYLIPPATLRPPVMTRAFFPPLQGTERRQHKHSLHWDLVGGELWFCDPIGWQQLFVWEGRNGG